MNGYTSEGNREGKGPALGQFVAEKLFWIHEPRQYTVTDPLITIVSGPHTDLWQRTYYGFSNDNAPLLLMKTSKRFFSFTARFSEMEVSGCKWLPWSAEDTGFRQTQAR